MTTTETLEAPPAPDRPLMPHQRYGEKLGPLVQPPWKLRHLFDKPDALNKALRTDDEWWSKARVAQEAGRSKATIGNWLDNYIKWAEGVRPQDDYTFVAPTYFGREPYWRAGEVRAWLMRTGKMTREGVFVPHKPSGRRRGVTEQRPRPELETSEMQREAPRFLAAYELMMAPIERGGEAMRSPDAIAALARQHGITERKVIRRLQRARDLRAGRKGSH